MHSLCYCSTYLEGHLSLASSELDKIVPDHLQYWRLLIGLTGPHKVPALAYMDIETF